jgi:hypothetical protein
MTAPEFCGDRFQCLFWQQCIGVEKNQNLAHCFPSAQVSSRSQAPISQLKDAAPQFTRHLCGPVMAAICHHNNFKVPVALGL